MMLCFVKGGGCRQEVWRPSETAWGRVGEEIPWTSQESGQGEPVGKTGMNEIVLYLLFLNLFCTFHISTDVTFQCSVHSPFVLRFEWNVLLTPHPPMQSNPCNCLYQQKKNVNKPVLKKPVKSKFAAFKASLKSSAAPAQTIEHDWGLFKVTSPLRKPSYHCEGKRDKRDQRQVCLDLMLRTKKKWCTSNIG